QRLEPLAARRARADVLPRAGRGGLSAGDEREGVIGRAACDRFGRLAHGILARHSPWVIGTTQSLRLLESAEDARRANTPAAQSSPPIDPVATIPPPWTPRTAPREPCSSDGTAATRRP